MPTATDLVTDLPADFEVFGQAVATSMADLLGGTSGQILAKNSNTDMDFVWIANDQGDITGITATSPLTGGGTSGAVTVGIQDALTTQKGAVQLSDSTSTTSSILASTPTATKAAYDLADAAIAKTTITTAGDIIYRNATVPTRLGIGTAGQVLAVNSGATAPEWITSTAGSYTLLGTATPSGGEIKFTSISASYQQLVLIVEDWYTSGGAEAGVRLNNDTTALNYQTVGLQGNAGGAVNYYKSNNGSFIWVTNTSCNTTDQNNVAVVTFPNYADTDSHKVIYSYVKHNNVTNGLTATSSMGAYNGSTSAISTISFYPGGGNMNGTAYLYGVK
jgi:hypothetical protein